MTMTTDPTAGQAPASSKRALDPIDRVSEILFGLIMVLTFTVTLGAAEAGQEDVQVMLIGALGCNLAWGIIDGVFYLMGCLADRGRAIIALKALRRTSNSQEAHRLISDALPPMIASIMKPTELEEIRARLAQLPEPPKRASLSKEDWRGAAGVLLLVFLSTFPVAVPFMLLGDAVLALRISNAIAIAMLFLMGYVFGRLTERNPLMVGLFMVLFGILLVVMTIALGG
jgi:VIT1/CCC1 family predicted Fe2+/Mn2+ transporter